jgi:hypothetical protein
MDDAEFLERFENQMLAEADFRHADHVRLAWLYLHRLPVAQALSTFSSGLKRFAARCNKAERYHETITWAYLLLINDRMARVDAPSTWPQFAARNPDLLTWKPTVLNRYYGQETLASDLARRTFLFPEPFQETQVRP